MATDDFFRARLDAMIDLKHPLAVLSTRLPWAAIEAAVAPKLARQALPAKRVGGKDLLGAYDAEFGGGVSPAVSDWAWHLESSQREADDGVHQQKIGGHHGRGKAKSATQARE